jgi:hypothetical protein
MIALGTLVEVLVSDEIAARQTTGRAYEHGMSYAQGVVTKDSANLFANMDITLSDGTVVTGTANAARVVVTCEHWLKNKP